LWNNSTAVEGCGLDLSKALTEIMNLSLKTATGFEEMKPG
jgi:hypothetical protein